MSFQLDGPIGVVEELLPASVAGMAEMNVDKRIVPRLEGFSDKRQTGLLRTLAAFFHIAFCARTNNIFPHRFATHTSRNNMVE